VQTSKIVVPGACPSPLKRTASFVGDSQGRIERGVVRGWILFEKGGLKDRGYSFGSLGGWW